MNQKLSPRVKRHFSVVVHSPDRVELRHGVWNATSLSVSDEGGHGRLSAIVRSLDGTQSVENVACAVGATEQDVRSVVDHLTELGAIEDGPSNFLDHYLDSIRSRNPTHRAGYETPISLIGPSRLATSVRDTIAAALPSVKIAHCGPEHPLARVGNPERRWLDDGLEFHRGMQAFEDLRGSFVVLLDEVVDPVRAQLVNRVCLHHDVPFFYAAVDGPFVSIGPLVLPGRTSCWECYETRVWMNLRESASYQRYKNALIEEAVNSGEGAVTPVAEALLAAHTSPELLSFITTGTAVTTSQVISIYLPTMEFAVNEVLRVPSCSACAPAPESDDHELYFDLRALRRNPR